MSGGAVANGLGRFRARAWRALLGDRIIRDGAVDTAAYCRSPLRIVYLLKEANAGDDRTSWDLREFLRVGGRGHTWNMVAYWSYALLNELPDWREVPGADERFRQRWLRQVAVVNLNKAGGGDHSSRSALLTVVGACANLLREQLRSLRPDVLVCGGTADLASAVLNEGGGPRWRYLSERSRYAEGTDVARWLLDVPHPQARLRGRILYGAVTLAARRLGITKVRARAGT